MKVNSLRASAFRLSAPPGTAGLDRVDRLTRLYANLSTAERRLSITLAEHRRASACAPTQPSVARAGLMHAALVDCCHALDWVADLPELARQHARHDGWVGADLVTQADAVASAATHLAVVLRGPGAAFRSELAAPALAGLAGLGPNETDASLILAAENVSLALSLAARLVLVLARLRARDRRARRLAMVFRSRPVERAVRVASLRLATGPAHAWPIAPPHPTAMAVSLVLAALVLSASRRVRPRLVGPAVVVVDLLVNLVGAVALPYAALLVLALVDLVTGIRAAGRVRRLAARGERECVGFNSDHRRPRRARREHRDQ